MAQNRFKQALAERRLQLGLWQALASPVTTELCAGAGFDWLLLDGEHGPGDIPMLLAQLQAAAPFPTHPVGRVPVGEAWIIKQYLDIGFQTLLVPMVETAEQAAGLVRACRYPPDGVRGVGSGIVRASAFNRTAGYLADADAQICLLVQVETKLGVENLKAIAATPGVDGVFIGPADLSAALGHRGNPGHPAVQAVIEASLTIIRDAGKAAGILMADTNLARRYIDLGFTFIAVGSDVGLLVKASDNLLASFQKNGTPASTASNVY
ncbi:aldolase/citrate lyase family protein [Niveispirillum sp. KHB5.9]|uniref:aldolase/citrate lyase family protein n=1 Tax=Niveispirillum sp. KHB5.9 TaxID=3400269 RepID=UPI003A881FAA